MSYYRRNRKNRKRSENMYFILCHNASYVLTSHGWVHLSKLTSTNHVLVVCKKVSSGLYLAKVLNEEMEKLGLRNPVQVYRKENFIKKYSASTLKGENTVLAESISVSTLLERERMRYHLVESQVILSSAPVELPLSQLVLPTETPHKNPKIQGKPVVKKKKRSLFSRLFGGSKPTPGKKMAKVPIKEEIPITEPPKKTETITKLTSHSPLAESYAFVQIIQEMSDSFDALDKLVSLGTAKMYSEALSKVEQKINDELHFIEFADLDGEDFDSGKICARLQELRLERRLVKDNTELSRMVREYIQNKKSAEIKEIAQKAQAMKKRKYKVRDPEHFQH